MRLVLDTNVLVAGVLSPHGPPAAVLRLIVSGRATVCFDARILDEYRAVLARPKFGFDTRLTDVVVDFLEDNGQPVSPAPLRLVLPDPDDVMFIEVAVAAKVDHLVTGNLRHFPSRSRRRVSVLSPRQLIERETE